MGYNPKSRLFVSNLPQFVTEDDLRELFSQQGTVEDVYLIHGKPSGFITMDTVANAQAAIIHFNGHDLYGNNIRVSIAKEKKAPATSWMLLVSNLPESYNNTMLEELFSSAGKVTKTYIIVDKDRKKSVGKAIVWMRSEDGFEQALDTLDGTDVEGHTIRVEPAIRNKGEIRDVEPETRERMLAIAEELGESEDEVLAKLVDVGYIMGLKFANKTLEKTYEVQANGGLKTHDGEGQRSIGGVYFFITKGRMSQTMRGVIFKQNNPYYENE